MIGLLLWLPIAAAAAEFHHVTVNVTDPAAAIGFYTSRFACEKQLFEGREAAIRAQNSWIFLNPVKKDPPSAVESALWHIGWGAPDMRKEYQRQLDLGTKFETPLTDISALANVPDFFYAYVDGPNHALIELNTARHSQFGHIHLFSADPVAAGQWYRELLGSPKPAREPSRQAHFYEGYQVGPSASFTSNSVHFIIYPDGFLKRRTALLPSKGRALDHIGFRVDDLNSTLAGLRARGVTVLGKPAPFRGSKTMRAAFIEGPDQILIQLVEGKP